MQERAAAHCRWKRGGARLAARAPAALHGRHQRTRRRAVGAEPLSGASHRARRSPHLSWPRTARRLRDARLEAPRRRRARVRRRARAVGHRHPRRAWRRPARRGPTGSACGSAGRTRATASRTRSPPSDVRVTRWVSLHGLSLNVDPDLSHYSGIVPCGIAGHGVTSLADLGAGHSMEVVDNALRRHFEQLFGPTRDAPGTLRRHARPSSRVDLPGSQKTKKARPPRWAGLSKLSVR